jgi:uncharacterized beta-barrel protein YwiB (DUF1934 family)
MLDDEYDEDEEGADLVEAEFDGKNKTVVGIAQAKAALRGKGGKSMTMKGKTGNKSMAKRPTTGAMDLEAQL